MPHMGSWKQPVYMGFLAVDSFIRKTVLMCIIAISGIFVKTTPYIFSTSYIDSHYFGICHPSPNHMESAFPFFQLKILWVWLFDFWALLILQKNNCAFE